MNPATPLTSESDNISVLLQAFERGGSFFLMGHIDPDGDCVGSLAGLSNLLAGAGGDNEIIVYEEIPKKFELAFAGLKTEVSLYDKDIPLENCDAIIALDCSDIDRLKPARDRLERIREQSGRPQLINIDHHEDNSHFGNINLVVPSAAATGEIIFDLANKAGLEIDFSAARALALAILADTGFFRYSNTSRRVIEKVLRLMDEGVDLYEINRSLYASHRPGVIQLLGRALTSLRTAAGGKIAYLKLRSIDYQLTGTGPEDREGFVNYARDIDGVEAGLIFSEEEKGIKVSFRSNEYLRVNDIAGKFGGGGHPRAAGCLLECDLEEAVETIIAEVKKHV